MPFRTERTGLPSCSRTRSRTTAVRNSVVVYSCTVSLGSWRRYQSDWLQLHIYVHPSSERRAGERFTVTECMLTSINSRNSTCQNHIRPLRNSVLTRSKLSTRGRIISDKQFFAMRITLHLAPSTRRRCAQLSLNLFSCTTHCAHRTKLTETRFSRSFRMRCKIQKWILVWHRIRSMHLWTDYLHIAHQREKYERSCFSCH